MPSRAKICYARLMEIHFVRAKYCLFCAVYVQMALHIKKIKVNATNLIIRNTSNEI